MSIDINRIYALLAQRPQIRTVEIADIIDCDPDQVEPRLAADISAGRVLVLPVTAPNGRSANGFEFSPEFMTTDAFREIVAKLWQDGEAARSSAPAPVPSPADSRQVKAPSTPDPVPAKAAPAKSARSAKDVARTTHPERAIQFIRDQGGRANNEALREALGLGPGASPSSYIRAALLDGRLTRDGRDWLLGVNAGSQPRYSPGKTVPRAIPAPPAPGGFRCARWSDGLLELQRDGETIATLAPAEQDAVMALMAGAA